MARHNLIAIVGMPGSGKSEAVSVFEKSGYFRVHFGKITCDETLSRGLRLNEANEKKVREELRKKHGMAAIAKLSLPKIRQALKIGNVVIDGLYSWEEYLLLKEKYPQMKTIAIFASHEARYARLARRKVRWHSKKDAISRDKAQLENLATGGPIAMADYTIINEGSVRELGKEINKLLNDL